MPQTTPDSFPRYEEEHPNMGNVDNNSCVEGTVAGGLLGGALGGVLSKKITGSGLSLVEWLQVA